MNRRARWAIGTVTVLGLLASLLYLSREPIALKLVGFAVQRRVPVGPLPGNHLGHRGGPAGPCAGGAAAERGADPRR